VFPPAGGSSSHRATIVSPSSAASPSALLGIIALPRVFASTSRRIRRAQRSESAERATGQQTAAEPVDGSGRMHCYILCQARLAHSR
jgi:hypothetical protein